MRERQSPRPRLRPAQLLIQFVVLPRKMGTGRDSLEVREMALDRPR